ncbi:Beta-casein [Trichinella spiralis]|uniref:Beta-casein n=1 Tax=Trichinella spiralis TaxID=6334 RepID=A0ABR3KAH4_TRISP
MVWLRSSFFVSIFAYIGAVASVDSSEDGKTLDHCKLNTKKHLSSLCRANWQANNSLGMVQVGGSGHLLGQREKHLLLADDRKAGQAK